MPVLVSGSTSKSQFESTHFDLLPATLNFQVAAANALLGGTLTDEDIRDVAGAPSGSTVDVQDVSRWGPTGEDRPPPGLYFLTSHPQFIDGSNAIGICLDPALGYFVYIKDVFFNDAAPSGMGAVALAKVVRFCLRNGIVGIGLYGAGGRRWINIQKGSVDTGKRWIGYYFWARCGFDMQLLAQDLTLITEFRHPSHLSSCRRVSDVLQDPDGPQWWQTCGSGHFMTFDTSSSTSRSVVTLEAYMALKGV
jgi:hypothetical protein